MNRTIRAIVGAVLILVITFSGITISQNLGRRWKLDVTERKLYTLSDGTKAILAKLGQPITAKLFYAKTAAMHASDRIRYFNDYYEYVKSLLEEYVAASNGMVRLEVIDPRPFSDEEEEAMRYGVQRFPISQEESFFFGLVVQTQFGVEKVIKFFSPDRQRFVEYDISSLIDTAITREKRRIGVMSSLPVMGEDVTPYMARMMQAQNQQPTPPWLIVRHLREKFDVTEVPTDVNDINDVDVLVVIHPKDLPERTQFAIDQFILKGGRTVICVDPHCVADRQQRNPMQMTVQKQSSDLDRLFRTWGLNMPANTFAGDNSILLIASLAANQREQPIMGFLGLTPPACFNQDEVITTDLNFVRMLFPGVLKVNADNSAAASDPNQSEQAQSENGPVITRTPLVTTTPQGNDWSVSSSYELMFPDPETLRGHFVPGNKPVVMGYLLTGRFASSFPEGIDVELGIEADEDDPNAPTTTTRHVTGLTEATEDGAVAVFSDVDFLWDQLAFNPALSRMVGRAIPQGDNSALLLNAIEEISGSGDLISIRSRGNYTRPFVVVEEIKQKAEEETANEIAVINAKIEIFNQQLQSLASNAEGEQQDLLDDTIIKEKQELELNIYEAKRQLRAVQAKKWDSIEELGNSLRRINMFGVPLVILLVAILLGVHASARARGYVPELSIANFLPDLPAGFDRARFSVWLTGLLHVVTGGLFTLIWFGLLHGKFPRVRPNDPPPLRAILFMFIPVVNVYWWLFCWYRLCARIEEQRAKYALRRKSLARLVGIVWISPWFLSVFAWMGTFIGHSSGSIGVTLTIVMLVGLIAGGVLIMALQLALFCLFQRRVNELVHVAKAGIGSSPSHVEAVAMEKG